MKLLFITIVLFAAALTFISCSSVSVYDNPDAYRDQVQQWRERANKNPKDAAAFKNLSIFYVQNRLFDIVDYYIDHALELLPNDPALLFYKGLCLEFFNKNDEAVKYYMHYPEVPEDSYYRDLMEGRYYSLLRQNAYADIGELIKNESQLTFSTVSDSILAVFPLIYQGINTEYISLSRGFSEMVSIDLAKVKQFTVLERVRIQAVMDEINLSQSQIVDQSTAPRTGKLLKAGVIVSGDYDITKDGSLKIALGSWNTETSERKSWVDRNGNLDDFFILQKEIVFDFLEKNNIELTQAEKEAIAYIPTHNLESFLEYSKGLLKEDAGDFKGASSFFQRAVELDPHFNAAGEKFHSALTVNQNGGSKEQILVMLRSEDAVVKNESIRLVEDRNQNLSNKISSNFIQSVDSRSPAQEEVNLELPLPPSPPSK